MIFVICFGFLFFFLTKVIERHFTLDKQQKGTDHKLSLEPHELKQLISHIRSIEIDLPIQQTNDAIVLKMLSKFFCDTELIDVKMAIAPVQSKHILECEMPCRLKLGKSLVYNCNLKCGMKLTRDDICAKVSEPFGISAEYFDEMIGKILLKDVIEDENVDKTHFHN